MCKRNIRDLDSRRFLLPVLMRGTAICICLAFANSPMKANAETPAPVDTQISMSSSSKIIIGEPIVLHYKLTNVTEDQGVGIALGTYKSQWNQISLTDTDGKSAEVVPDQRPSSPRGLHSTGVYLLRPKTAEEDYIVATRFLHPLHPGKYVLTVQVNLPYTTEVAIDGAFSEEDLEGKIKLNNEFVTHRFVFPITIWKANPTQLRAKAVDLSQTAMVEKDSKKYLAEIDALFSMPEAVASTSWEAIAARPGLLGAEVVASKLAEVSSIKSADILVKMLDDRTLSSDQVAFVSGKLSEVYNSGRASLKQHLKSVVTERGSEMPESIQVPQVTD